jgi:hypothetical protein
VNWKTKPTKISSKEAFTGLLTLDHYNWLVNQGRAAVRNFDKGVIISKHFQHLKETPHPEWELCVANTSRTKLKKRGRRDSDVCMLEATSVFYRPDALINVVQKLLNVHTEGGVIGILH